MAQPEMTIRRAAYASWSNRRAADRGRGARVGARGAGRAHARDARVLQSGGDGPDAGDAGVGPGWALGLDAATFAASRISVRLASPTHGARPAAGVAIRPAPVRTCVRALRR